ncbi:MAG: HD domain-containing protein [Clostridiales bacterium]|nr:HD domain-containing protein [Clostridiales bacterium]
MMERVNAIARHPVFAEHLARLEVLEQTRIFCRHDLSHLMDVARLMWIAALERQLPLNREVVYAAALLHDLGRVEQMGEGIPHHQASADLAARILPEAGFSANEIAQIQNAIACHRGDGGENMLGQLLYWADKKSRPCWVCAAKNKCNWPQEKKNWEITR